MPELHVPNDAELASLAGELAACLLQRGLTMATAESCTGGWIAKCCTDLAGSSDWFERGYVSYSNPAKQQLLGVNSATLNGPGAVSREVALEMAAGAVERAGVDLAVAVTGVAGPGGGSAEKPVGTVWFGFAQPGRCEAARCCFEGDREAVRRQTVAYALQGLLDRYVE